MGRIKVHNTEYNCKTYSIDIRPPLACSEIVYKIKNVTKNLECDAKAGSVQNLTNGSKCQIERGNIIEVRVPKLSWIVDYEITKPFLLVFYDGLKDFREPADADDVFSMVNEDNNYYIFRIDGSNNQSNYYIWGYHTDGYGQRLYIDSINLGFAVGIKNNNGDYYMYDVDDYRYNCTKKLKIE